MATLTAVKPATGTWCDTFPKQQMTEQESLRFVKKLLAIAVSNIAYLRVILPENAFVDRSVEGVNLKILKCDKSCPGVPLLVDWLKGAFDALEKKYLRVLILGIYLNKDDPNTLIEAYNFKFSYSDLTTMDIYKNNKKISSTDTSNKTKQATVALLRTLIVLMGTLNPLPESYAVTMKLLYYDKVTPLDYEPPGFEAADTDTFNFEDKPMKIRAGDVSTLFHALRVRVTTISSNFKADIAVEDEDSAQHLTLEGLDIEEDDQDSRSQTLQDSLPNQLQTKNQVDPQTKCAAKSVDQNIEVDEMETPQSGASQKSKPSGSRAMKPPKTPTNHLQQENVQQDSEPSTKIKPNETRDVADFGVRCPCGCNEDDGLMILCAICGHWQHGLCFLVQSAEEAPELHICNLCADTNISSRQPTDASLVGMSGDDLQMTCLWRRALVACLEEKVITPIGFYNRLGIDKDVVAKIMQRLEAEEYLKPARGKFSKQAKSVNFEKIQRDGIPKYFQRKFPAKQIVLNDCVMDKDKDSSRSKKVPEDGELRSESEAEGRAKDIQSIVTQTSKLNVSSAGKTKSRKSLPPSNGTVYSVQSSPMSVGSGKPEVKLLRSNSTACKRPIADQNDVYEFEFSSTQEDYEPGPQTRKRKKASISKRDFKS